MFSNSIHKVSESLGIVQLQIVCTGIFLDNGLSDDPRSKPPFPSPPSGFVTANPT